MVTLKKTLTLKEHLENSPNQPGLFHGPILVSSTGSAVYQFIPRLQDTKPVEDYICVEPRKDDGSPAKAERVHVLTRQHINDRAYTPD